MKKNYNNFCLSFDVDWAPDKVLEFCFEPVIKKKIKATIFITHSSPYIIQLIEDYSNLFEFAIHPNFNPFFENSSKKDIKNILNELLQIIPNCLGVRSHSHVTSSQIISTYETLSLKYDSNIFAFNENNLKPLLYSKNFVRIPHFFQDDAHFLRNMPMEMNSLSYNTAGLKVFDFHPIHIFLNTKDINQYNIAKQHYSNPKKLKDYVNNNSKGILDLYEEVLGFFEKKNTSTLIEIARSYLNPNNIEK